MLEHHIFSAGPVIYPLVVCSLLALAIIVERCCVLVFYSSRLSDNTVQQFYRDQLSDTESSRGLLQGLTLLSTHRLRPKNLRDELLSAWLAQQRQILHARTRWLALIGALAPLLGLLGTVLGIITMFQEVSLKVGPITPALLASGMWEAMATTALGLIIAIPALGFGQVLSIWGDHRLLDMTNRLNKCSLWLELQIPLSTEKQNPPNNSTGSGSSPNREVCAA